MAATLLDELLRDAQPIWRAMTEHPFLRELATGQLPRERFDFWVQQDYLFVQAGIRFLALLIARAPDEELRRGLLDAAVAFRNELAIFEDYARAHNLTLVFEPTPVCLGYASYLLATAATGSLAEALTVLWGAEKAYYDAWSSVRNTLGLAEPYARWIENWTSPQFAAWVDWLGQQLLRRVTESERPVIRAAFFATARYEYLFWDMVYTRAGWPV
ncbi:Aminopyrimidine aminohydrolase [bacterium HR27]|nr:Aminopyrimidine aminohydrolase [bacterium HR27]